jgi:hypothetical protein
MVFINVYIQFRIHNTGFNIVLYARSSVQPRYLEGRIESVGLKHFLLVENGVDKVGIVFDLEMK